MVTDPLPYEAAFPTGSKVRVVGLSFLEHFMRTWVYHHKLQPEQLSGADRTATVKSVGFYHGGDPVYTLVEIPVVS